jgi:hypothetical protein
MMSILKRTTAIAALAALPLAPAAAQAQSQADQQTPSQIMPETESATQYGVPGDVLPEGEHAGAKNDDAEGGSTQSQTGTPESAAGSGAQGNNANQSTGGQTKAQKPQGQQAGAQQDQAAGEQPTGADEVQRQAEGAAGPDAVVARVGDTDIMRSDVIGVIGSLPPQLQQQPADMLIPMALDQLVLRELILQEAREAGLESDPDVEAKLADAADAPEQARENAMVQVWLDRELEGAVTDQKVQETYGSIENQLGDQVPPLDQIRPQIEQELRRTAFVELSEELQANADVTLFGPDGEPIVEGAAAQ